MSNGDETPFGYVPNADDSEDDTVTIREDGPAGRSGFDPTPYMRQLRGRGGNQDYLDVKWRVLWLRKEHPDAEIVTEHVRIDEGMAIFKATVTVPTGGKATGYGSETAGDFGDFIEKAETKAIGRALNALGYGAKFSEKGEDEAPPPTAAMETSPPPAAPRPRPAGDEPVPIRPAEARPAAPPARAARPAAAPQASSGDGDDSDDVDMADMTWTAFWAWARPLGYNKRGDIEQFLGHTINTLTPAEVRAEMRTARGEG